MFHVLPLHKKLAAKINRATKDHEAVDTLPSLAIVVAAHISATTQSNQLKKDILERFSYEVLKLARIEL